MWLFNRFKKTKISAKQITSYASGNISLSSELDSNMKQLKGIFKDCNDIIFREVKIFKYTDNPVKVMIIYTHGLVDTSLINQDIIKPLNHGYLYDEKEMLKESKIITDIEKRIFINDVETTTHFEKIIDGILTGSTVMMVDTCSEALILNTEGWENRSIEESPVESVTRGAKDSFIENLRTNTALIRRKIKDPNLKMKELKVGSRTRTNVAVVYMEDIVSKVVLENVLNQLENIEVDGIFDSGYIEQFLENSPFSIFPQMQITERPDKVCGNLLEGRITIIVDGSPDALILPVSFIQFFQSPEDYYERYIAGNMIRLLRVLGFIIATSFPAIYVAVATFHQELLPTDLALDIAKSRIEVPFPPIIEALLMEVTIELLREASARLPVTIGQTIGIVGAIVIGDAAVKAGIVSPVMVIVVAITAIGSYVFPHFSTSFAVRLIRIPMILMAATFGAFGIIITWIWIINHLCKLNSFGYPYLSPFAPLNTKDIKDTVIRNPLWAKNNRPSIASDKNKKRK
ncbi:MAG: spore germination protein [Clostridiaceae bacterium]|nr:spore germination protein [Clostridiaceae bacterium]